MHRIWILMLGWLGAGIASADEPKPEEEAAIQLVVSQSDKGEYGVAITEYTLDGIAPDDCVVFVTLLAGHQKGVYSTKVNASEPCQATESVVNSWFFSPTRNWLRLDRAPPLNFLIKVRPGAETKKIGVPETLVAKDTVLPAIAEAIPLQRAAPKKPVAPKYPVKAQRKRTEGACQVRLFIDEEGKPYDVQIEQCPEVFHESVTTAAYKWRFTPMKDDGIAAKSQYLLHLRFKLN